MFAYIIDAHTQSIYTEFYSDVLELPYLISSDCDMPLIERPFCGDNRLILDGRGFYPIYESTEFEYMGIIERDDLTKFPFIGRVLVVGKEVDGGYSDCDKAISEIFAKFSFIEKSEVRKWIDEEFYTEI